MVYKAGQYMEWMLPHAKADSRGIRRYFTITSAPEETVLRLALKVPDKSSTYKQALLALIPGDKVIASQRAGDFLMPKDATKKLAWVAGGIGVTPFVSQSTEMLTTAEKRDVVLFYATPTAGDAAYVDTLSAATTLIQVVGGGEVPAGGETGFVTADVIARRVPDYIERTWFISGPPPMVNATNAALRSLKVPQQQIVRDFFPGLA
jgi:glycine betaine catabolism B